MNLTSQKNGFLSFRISPTTVTGNYPLLSTAFPLMDTCHIWPESYLAQCVNRLLLQCIKASEKSSGGLF